jgi:pyruvate dehydrogenase E1 component alpha subunit
MVEERIALEYPKGEIRCPTHLSVGQELLPALFKLSSEKNDYAVSTHRSHAHYLAKGGSLDALIAELYGKESGCSAGNGGSMHLIDLRVNFMGSTAIVGNTIPIGVGLAQASKLNGDKRISFIFLGEGAAEEGVFYESINYCAVQKLPAVFLCENNGYSVYADLEARQPVGRKLTRMVNEIGVESIWIDSTDPLSALEKLRSAIKKARSTGSPLFVEIDTFRFLEHCGPNSDDHLNYRDQNYIAESILSDPLEKIASLLRDTLLDFPQWKTNKALEISSQIDFAFSEAKKAKFPEYANLEEMVYEKVIK